MKIFYILIITILLFTTTAKADFSISGTKTGKSSSFSGKTGGSSENSFSIEIGVGSTECRGTMCHTNEQAVNPGKQVSISGLFNTKSFSVGLTFNTMTFKPTNATFSALTIGPELRFNHQLSRTMTVFALCSVGLAKAENKVDGYYEDVEANPSGLSFDYGLGISLKSKIISIGMIIRWQNWYWEVEKDKWDPNVSNLFVGFTLGIIIPTGDK